MAEVKFKSLTIDNAFDFCEVLNAIGADQLFKNINADEILKMADAENGDAKKIGMNVLMRLPEMLIKYLPKARKEVYRFFAGCLVWDNGTSVTVDDVSAFKLPYFVRILKDFSKHEDLTDFFQAVAELLGMEQTDSGNASTEDTQTRKRS